MGGLGEGWAAVRVGPVQSLTGCSSISEERRCCNLRGWGTPALAGDGERMPEAWLAATVLLLIACFFGGILAASFTVMASLLTAAGELTLSLS